MHHRHPAVLYRGSRIGAEVLVADHAFVREHCLIGNRVLIGCGVAVENRVEIGSCTKIQTNAYITAHSRLEEQVFIAPGVITTNDNYMGRTEERFRHIRGPTVKRRARVGGGAILLPGVVVAEESFIAAGAVVNRDTEPAWVYAGVPARPLRRVPEGEMRRKLERGKGVMLTKIKQLFSDSTAFAFALMGNKIVSFLLVPVYTR